MNTNELNEWIKNSPYTEQEEVIVMLRQQQNLLDEYHEQALNDSRAISKLVGEMAEKEAEIEALKAKWLEACDAIIEVGKRQEI